MNYLRSYYTISGVDIETTIEGFYDQFPYPSFKIGESKDLEKLPFQRFLFEIGKSYVKKGKILDAGCGTGELALLFAKEGFESFGTDISTESLKIAKSTSRKLKIPATFRKMDVLDLKFPENFFDLTICNGVLHHTKDPVLGFEKLVRVTKPGGKIIIVVYNKYGSLPRRVLGKIAQVFGGRSKKDQIAFLRRIFRKRFESKSDPVVADAFLNPYELSFSIREILRWFEKENVKYLESAPPIELEYYPKILTTLLKRKALLDTWLSLRGKVGTGALSHNPLPYFLTQMIWLLSLRGSIFVTIGERRRG